MSDSRPRIAIPVPTSSDPAYNERCFEQYVYAIERSGGAVVSISLDQDPSQIARLAAACSGVLLPGSPADVHPQKYGEAVLSETAARDVLREAADELLLQDAFNLRKPIFGICYGHQSMNVWKGGTLIQHLKTNIDHAPGSTVERAHRLEVLDGARHLASAFDGCELHVNSSHHQAVGVPGDGLKPAALAVGDGVIEAVEAREGFVVGVQWHPERTFSTDPASRKLFEDFVAASAAWHESEVIRASYLPRP